MSAEKNEDTKTTPENKGGEPSTATTVTDNTSTTAASSTTTTAAANTTTTAATSSTTVNPTRELPRPPAAGRGRPEILALSDDNPYAIPGTLAAGSATGAIRPRVVSSDSVRLVPGAGPIVINDHLEDVEFARTTTVPAGTSSLEQLLYHHLRQFLIPTRRDKAVIATSVVVAGASLALYIMPTHAYADGNTALEIPLQIGTNGANFGVAVYLTMESINIFRHRLPRDLAHAINAKASGVGAMILRIAGVGTVALLSALPLATSAYGSVDVKIIVALTMAVQSFYGLNNNMIEHGSYIKRHISRSAKNKAYHQTLAAFNHAVTKITDEIVRSPAGVPTDLTFSNLHNAGDYLKFFAKQSRTLHVEAHRPLSAIQLLTRRIIPGLSGSALLIAGLSGYLLSMYNAINDEFQDEAVSIPSTIALSSFFLYLSATFGAGTFMNVTDVITCNGSKPLAFQLYPIRTMVSMMLFAALASFSFATSAQMILGSPTFQEGGPMYGSRDLFVGLAIAAAVIFNNYANQKLGFKIIEGYASLHGTPDIRERANFSIKMRNFLNDVNTKMSPEKFAESLLQLTEEEQIALVPLLSADQNVKELLETAAGHAVDDTQMNTGGFFSSMGTAVKANIRRGYENLSGNDLGLEAYEQVGYTRKATYGTVPTVVPAVEPADAPAPTNYWESFKGWGSAKLASVSGHFSRSGASSNARRTSNAFAALQATIVLDEEGGTHLHNSRT